LSPVPATAHGTGASWQHATLLELRASPSPPLFASAHLNNALWHFAFNRLADVNDQLVTGREDVYFGWQFATKAARPLPDHAVRYYVDTLAAEPAALHASFAIYRALDDTIAQNQQRKTRRLSIPVPGIGGEKSLRDQAATSPPGNNPSCSPTNCARRSALPGSKWLDQHLVRGGAAAP
jgi:hypothetical protein